MGQTCEPSSKGDADSDVREHRTEWYFDVVYIALSVFQRVNLLTPNVKYSGRTAPLTSKVALYILIQQI